MRVKEIIEKKEMHEVIGKSQVCWLAMVDGDGLPYVVPMNFGFDGSHVYLHGAQFGRKMDILRKYPRVAINFSADFQLRYQSEHVACSYSMKYRSVLVEGEVEFIEDLQEKISALNVIMAQYSPREFKYNEPSLKEVCVFRVSGEKMTGRKMHYQ